MNNQADESKDAAEALRPSDAWSPDADCWRSLVQGGADVTVLVDPDGSVRWVSASASRTLGRTPGELVGRMNFDLVHPVDRDGLAAAYSTAVAKGGTAGPVEYRLRDDSGRWRRVEALITNMVDDPAVGAVVLAVRDVSDRVSVISPGRLEGRYRDLLEHSPDGVLVVDEYLFIEYASSMAARLLGATSAGALFGQPFSRFVPPAEVDSVLRAIWGALRGGAESRKSERTLIRFDGRRIDVELSCASVFHAGRRAVQIVVRDITRQKRARRRADERVQELEQYAVELQETNRELESFGAIARHDLLQPIQAVFGFLAMLEDGKASGPAQVSEWARHALRSLRRMHAMLDSLGARSSAGGDSLQVETVDCMELVADVLDDLAPTIAASGGHVNVAPLPEIVADPVQLGELLQNLVANGLKFVAEGVKPLVDVSASRDGALWRFAVEDNGIGIPATSLEEVFEPFRRLAADLDFPGTGLGLYTCRRIVDRHGGAIWAERLDPTGTRICFTIPDIALPSLG